MKNIIKIKNFKSLLLLFTVLVMGVSCSDFLLEDPKSELDLGKYFSDPNHAYSAVNRLYADGPRDIYNVMTGDYSGSYGMLYGHLTGFFNNEYKGQEIQCLAAQNLNIEDPTLNSYAMRMWETLYFEIANANTAIKGIPGVPELSDDEINYQMAQARFFRAFSYFILVRTFGDVPLITEPYTTLDDIYMARTPSLDVYNQIVEDLIFAVEHLNGGTMYSNGQRVTSGAARTLLAEVYLTMSGYPLNVDRYAEAAAAAKAVISSGDYGLLTNDNNSTGSAFNKMRLESNDVSNEYIYYLEFMVGESENHYAKWSLPNTLANESAYTITINTFGPTQEFINLYDVTNDLRVQENQLFHTTFNGSSLGGWAPWLWHDEEGYTTAHSEKNFVVYRYTDVLLIAAEAVVQSGGSLSEAAGYLAQVKDRAIMNQTEGEIITNLIALNPTDFIEEVWTERYRESCLEFKSWFNMIRTRKYPVGDGNGGVNYVDIIGHTNAWGATYAERHLLWQLPEEEIQSNSNLIQNP